MLSSPRSSSSLFFSQRTKAIACSASLLADLVNSWRLKALWGLDADAKVIPQRFQQAINYSMFSTSPLDILQGNQEALWSGFEPRGSDREVMPSDGLGLKQMQLPEYPRMVRAPVCSVALFKSDVFGGFPTNGQPQNGSNSGFPVFAPIGYWVVPSSLQAKVPAGVQGVPGAVGNATWAYLL